MALVGMAGLAAGFLLGHAWTRPAPDVASTASDGFTVYEVAAGEVHQAVNTAARVAWPEVQRVDVPVIGRVTGGLPADHIVEAGETVMEVDGQAVVAAMGSVPAFRDLGVGVEGDDVRQLQQYLRDNGFDVEIDGRFRQSTTRAVRAWSAQRGFGDSSSVPLGRLLFLPSLPAVVFGEDDLRLGAPLPAPAISVRSLLPEADVSVQPTLAGRLDSETVVRLTLPVGTIEARVGGPGLPAEDGSLRVPLILPATMCDFADCGAGDEPVVNAPAEIELVPRTTGPVVPVSALVTSAGGDAGVVLHSGERRDVTVLVSANGLAVVDGLAPGDRIRVPSL
jgi:hypothetical protein